MNNNEIYKSDQSPAEIKADQHFFLYAEIWSQSVNGYSLRKTKICISALILLSSSFELSGVELILNLVSSLKIVNIFSL